VQAAVREGAQRVDDASVQRRIEVVVAGPVFKDVAE